MKTRIPPEKVPTDPAKFKAWADEACREWPTDLTTTAFRLAENAVTRDEFIEAYRAWLATVT